MVRDLIDLQPASSSPPHGPRAQSQSPLNFLNRVEVAGTYLARYICCFFRHFSKFDKFMDHEPSIRFNKSVAPVDQIIVHLQRISRYVPNERSSRHPPPLRHDPLNHATDANRIRTVRSTQAGPGFGRSPPFRSLTFCLQLLANLFRSLKFTVSSKSLSSAK